MTNNRFVNNTLSELQEANRSPIFGYQDSPLLTLEEAVEKITPFISHSMDYVVTAKKKYNRHSALLTRDESAAIYLYTMPTSFFSALNSTLRAEDRDALKPWFTFLKLFISALEKLPSMRATVWRGVNYDDSLTFVDNNVHIWWSINTCSLSLNVIQPYLSERGTLFAIDAIHAKDISAFSAIPDEQEVILMPGTRVRNRCQSLSFLDRLFVLHLEEINQQNKSQSVPSFLFDEIKQKYQRNSRLSRIMNPSKSFPIEQSYINLAIVTAKDQHEKEKQLFNIEYSDAILNTYEEIYGMKNAIDVKNIFESCKTDKKQVLMFGRAGIGKSTFCRYIAYQWAKGSYWSEYELLALIPLRRLTTQRYPPLLPGQTYSPVDLVIKEVFQYDLSKKEEKTFKEHFDVKKTLWILDGYDEIVQNVPSHLEYLLEQLLKTPNHILTSRPYLNILSYDMQIEITGFTDESIEGYVQQFFYQMKDELDDASIRCQTLLKFLKSNKSVWGVAHIPVNLELICSVWSNMDRLETKALTITALYTVMTEWLCRRYLAFQNINIERLSNVEVHQLCQKEVYLLENLAFNAMESNTIIIRPASLKKALDEAKVSLYDHQHLLNIGILKSFAKQGIGTSIESEKDHYFVHLSFQEYFASRYLINALKCSSNEKAVDFIKHQKYNQRYASVFTFTSGILSEFSETSAMNIFWDSILGEPLDLVGIRHMQLVISCLEEAYDTSAVPRRTHLLQWIAMCIRHNLSTKNKIILKHMSQSLQKAQSVLSDQAMVNVLLNLRPYDDIKRKTKVLSFISELGISNPSNELIVSITATLNDRNRQLRGNACKVLGQIGEKAATCEVISKLVSALEDDSKYVRASACEALGMMGEKAATNVVLNMLVSALSDKSGQIRCNACEALGMMGEKAAKNEVITEIAVALKDAKWNVRKNACKALEKMGEKAATNEIISNLVRALGDESRDVRTSACEALGTMAEKGAKSEVISKLTSALRYGDKNVRANACEFLKTMREKASTDVVISQLLSALGDDSKYVRANACKTLGVISEKAVTNDMMSKLVSALEDESEETRWNACQVLGMIGEKAATSEVINKLVSALGDKSKHVRAIACEILKMMSEKAAPDIVISKLLNALRDDSKYVRANACKTLSMMDDKAATNEVICKLLNALEDKNEVVRTNACRALGNMGEKAATNEVIYMLVNALEDQFRWVRSEACGALGKICGKLATNEVITKLVSVLVDNNTDVKAAACRALGSLGENAATNEVISELLSALEDNSEVVRASACEALEKMGKKVVTNEVISKLVYALEDRSENVRAKAYQAIGEMGGKAATNEVISKLVRALEDETGIVKTNVCQALEKMGEKVATNEVISKLVVLMTSNEHLVSESAAETVGNIISSSAAVIHLDPKIVLDLLLSKHESGCLKNVSGDQFINFFVITKNPDWLTVAARFALLEGNAVTIIKDKVVLYDRGEPLELSISILQQRQQLIEALIDQAKRLHLYPKMLSECEAICNR